MPRTYKPKIGAKHYVHHSDLDIAKATAAITRGMTYRKAAEKFKIPATVLYRRVTKPSTMRIGGQTVLNSEEEELLVQKLICCGNWGYPLTDLDLRMIVKGYLDRRGREVAQFKENFPGYEWTKLFLRRHHAQLSVRVCQNIKRARAGTSHDQINAYFDELGISLAGVRPENIINYDETNLTDDPGRKKVIVKRGCKYPERVMNSSKSSTSLMFAGTADGKLLDSYVVYRAERMHDTWTMGGPKGTRYNRTKSGWFDMACFEDWFKKIILPYAKSHPGKKVLIGDNLSSHLSLDVITKCEEHDISFIFLPPNSTHLTQPLDVAFFRPMKIGWRKILEKWKVGPGRKQSTIPKDTFPSLLLKLQTALDPNARQNLLAGFQKCGISPLNRKKILERIPSVAVEDPALPDANAAANCSLIELLNEMRYSEPAAPKRRKKMVKVAPGKSIRGVDFQNASSSDESTGKDAQETDIHESPEYPTPQKRMKPTIKKNLMVENVFPIPIGDISVDMWVLVDFSAQPTSHDTKQRKRNLYIGKIMKTLASQEFEATFLRSTFRSDGSTFSFPTIEDRSVFKYGQILGKIDPPTEQRRGILKFNVNSTTW